MRRVYVFALEIAKGINRQIAQLRWKRRRAKEHSSHIVAMQKSTCKFNYHNHRPKYIHSEYGEQFKKRK